MSFVQQLDSTSISYLKDQVSVLKYFKKFKSATQNEYLIM